MKRSALSRGKILTLLPVMLAVSACSVFGGGDGKKPKTPSLGSGFPF